MLTINAGIENLEQTLYGECCQDFGKISNFKHTNLSLSFAVKIEPFLEVTVQGPKLNISGFEIFFSILFKVIYKNYNHFQTK